MKRSGESSFGVLDLLALIEDAADTAGVQEHPDDGGVSGDSLVVGNVNENRRVEGRAVLAPVAGQDVRRDVTVSGDLFAPVLDERLLSDYENGVHRIALKPKQGEINGDLGLAEPLLVENRRVG